MQAAELVEIEIVGLVDQVVLAAAETELLLELQTVVAVVAEVLVQVGNLEVLVFVFFPTHPHLSVLQAVP
jgi:hypothetical protein